jgi:AcrR family transcriptional regulator
VQLTASDNPATSRTPAKRATDRPPSGRRAARKQATQAALRRAAVELIAERGYEATSTDEIARAAGVSARTFFNYFPTKDAVVFLPEGILPALVSRSLRERPAGEDPAASMAAAAIASLDMVAELVGQEDAHLMRATLRLVDTEPEVRRIMFERRRAAEEAAWQTLVERGVAPEDLSARAAVVSVVSLCFMALLMWADLDGREPLTGVLARCLLAAPHPARLAAGVTTPPR